MAATALRTACLSWRGKGGLKICRALSNPCPRVLPLPERRAHSGGRKAVPRAGTQCPAAKRSQDLTASCQPNTTSPGHGTGRLLAWGGLLSQSLGWKGSCPHLFLLAAQPVLHHVAIEGVNVFAELRFPDTREGAFVPGAEVSLHPFRPLLQNCTKRKEKGAGGRLRREGYLAPSPKPAFSTAPSLPAFGLRPHLDSGAQIVRSRCLRSFSSPPHHSFSSSRACSPPAYTCCIPRPSLPKYLPFSTGT